MATVSPTKTTQRIEWMDSLRGIAILLLLFWHAFAIPDLLGTPMPDWLRNINNAFLPFRMPMLMFLSGMLLEKSLRKPLPTYYEGKLVSNTVRHNNNMLPPNVIRRTPAL